MQGPLPVPVPTGPLGLPREAFQKKNYGDSEIGPTPLNPPTPTSDREKKCRDSCVEI